MWTYLAGWFPMLAIAIANGLLRQQWYGRRMAELAAHQVSTVVAIVLFGFYMWLLFRYRPLESGMQAIGVGFAWVAMTVTFEFLFGHYVAGHDWWRLLHDYDLAAGRLWSLLLLWIACGPCLIHRLQP